MYVSFPQRMRKAKPSPHPLPKPRQWPRSGEAWRRSPRRSKGVGHSLSQRFRDSLRALHILFQSGFDTFRFFLRHIGFPPRLFHFLLRLKGFLHPFPVFPDQHLHMLLHFTSIFDRSNGTISSPLQRDGSILPREALRFPDAPPLLPGDPSLLQRRGFPVNRLPLSHPLSFIGIPPPFPRLGISAFRPTNGSGPDPPLAPVHGCDNSRPL